LAQQKRAVLSGSACDEASPPKTILGVVMLGGMRLVMLNGMVVAIVAVVFFGSKGRTCKGHQKQGGGKNLFHGINVARLERRR
jgi:hypothetical protein